MSDVKKNSLCKLVLEAAGAAPSPSEAGASPQRERPAHSSLWHAEQAEAAERAAAAEKAEHSIERTVFKLIENLDNAAAPELVRRPVSAPEPIDPNTPRGRLQSLVGRIIIGNNGR